MPELDLDAARVALLAHLEDIRERRGVITKAPERGSGVSFGKLRVTCASAGAPGRR